MTSKKVTFQFRSLNHLWDFKREINAIACDIRPAELLLTCNCSEEHIELAIEKYGAEIIEPKETA